MCIRVNTFVLINYTHYRHNCAAFKMPVKIWYKFGKFFGTVFYSSHSNLVDEIVCMFFLLILFINYLSYAASRSFFPEKGIS